MFWLYDTPPENLGPHRWHLRYLRAAGDNDAYLTDYAGIRWAV